MLSFFGREALNQPYRFDIELLSRRPDLELEALLQRPGCLTFGATGKGLIHGLVFPFPPGLTKGLQRHPDVIIVNNRATRWPGQAGPAGTVAGTLSAG